MSGLKFRSQKGEHQMGKANAVIFSGEKYSEMYMSGNNQNSIINKTSEQIRLHCDSSAIMLPQAGPARNFTQINL